MNHSKWKAVWALLLCVLLCCTMALAEESEAEPPQLGEDIEVEGVASDEEDNVSELDAQGVRASIEGLTPLYRAVIKPFTSNGNTIRMRAEQSSESDVVCAINKGETITVYAVYPSYVLAEYNGNVGYVIRTWISEDVVPIDPASTPPYGTVLSQYVATTTDVARSIRLPITTRPSTPFRSARAARSPCWNLWTALPKSSIGVPTAILTRRF